MAVGVQTTYSSSFLHLVSLQSCLMGLAIDSYILCDLKLEGENIPMARLLPLDDTLRVKKMSSVIN